MTVSLRFDRIWLTLTALDGGDDSNGDSYNNGHYCDGVADESDSLLS
jgi:hypothetical protein